LKRHGVETAPPEALTTEQRKQLALRLESNLPQYYPRTWPKDAQQRARQLVAECLAWHEANGRWRINWVATCFQWISKHHRFQSERKAEYREREYPQERRDSGPQGELVPIGNVFSIVDRIAGKR
jgi:hypothetical protein